MFYLLFQVEKKFGQLHQFLVGKPYYKHIVKPFFAVENCLNEGEDIQVNVHTIAFINFCKRLHV